MAADENIFTGMCDSEWDSYLERQHPEGCSFHHVEELLHPTKRLLKYVKQRMHTLDPYMVILWDKFLHRWVLCEMINTVGSVYRIEGVTLEFVNKLPFVCTVIENKDESFASLDCWDTRLDDYLSNNNTRETHPGAYGDPFIARRRATQQVRRELQKIVAAKEKTREEMKYVAKEAMSAVRKFSFQALGIEHDSN